MDPVERMKQLAPDQFHSLVKMHLSFLLDLNTDECDCSFIYDVEDQKKECSKSAPNKKKINYFPGTPKKMAAAVVKTDPGVMAGAPLTMEGVCQIYQIVEYLNRHLTLEGLFRKHGNIKKQQTLRERLNRGVAVDLDDQEFSVHECAAVFKMFLADLKEPLLTDAYYRAHCQVADLKEADADKRLQCLQLLFLLIPHANYVLLKDTLTLLQKVAQHKEDNKMDATNLATVFATHIMCPRKLSPACLQANHQLFIRAVAIMINKADELFAMPPQLCRDADAYWKRDDLHHSTPKRTPSFNSSPVVNTVYSFVDRERTQQLASQTTTETALAELYAQVQSMPESAQKRKLIHKLNDANGCGTPASSKAKTGSRLKNLLRTPKGGLASSKKQQKEGGRNHGSYSLQHDRDIPTAASFKWQHSGAQQQQENNSPLLLPAATKPPPPPRTSSLPVKEATMIEEKSPRDDLLLQTPRCRKPLMVLSPDLDETSSPPNDDDSGCNVSVSSSVISAEAAALLNGEMSPSDSMAAFLNGQENEDSLSPGHTPGRRQTRKRSLTELGAVGPLLKTPPPPTLGTKEGVYFETNL